MDPTSTVSFGIVIEDLGNGDDVIAGLLRDVLEDRNHDGTLADRSSTTTSARSVVDDRDRHVDVAADGLGVGADFVEWELSETDLPDVLTWIDANSAGRSAIVWVVVRDGAKVQLIRLAGIDPLDPADGWPSWATTVPAE